LYPGEKISINKEILRILNSVAFWGALLLEALSVIPEIKKVSRATFFKIQWAALKTAH